MADRLLFGDRLYMDLPISQVDFAPDYPVFYLHGVFLRSSLHYVCVSMEVTYNLRKN